MTMFLGHCQAYRPHHVPKDTLMNRRLWLEYSTLSKLHDVLQALLSIVSVVRQMCIYALLNEATECINA